MNFLKGLIIGASLLFLRAGQASDFGAILSSSGLRLDGQAGGWYYYQSDDAPEGAYLACCGTWSNQIEANIALGQAMPAGDYTLFVKAVGYDQNHRVDAVLGGASASAVLNDRDADKYWTRIGPLRLGSSATNLRLTFARTASVSQPRVLLRAIYLVPDISSNIYVTATDQFMRLQYPTSSEYDNSPPIKGNLLANSSFETGVGNAWSTVWGSRNWTSWSLWDTNVAYRGRSSLRLRSQTSPPQEFISPPIRLKPNKRYTLSAYVRTSGGRQYAGLRLVNSQQPPAGSTAVPDYSTGKLFSASSTWERLVVSDRILAYPGEQFHVKLWCQQYSEGPGDVWFDAIQLEEGDATPHQPQEAVELGVRLPRADSTFQPGELQVGQLFIANQSTSPFSSTARYEIRDHLLRLQKQGSLPVSVAANSTASVSLPLDLQRLGSFRGTVWMDGAASEDEFLYSVLPVPATTGLDDTSVMGIHSDHTDWQLGLMQRAGIKWTRNLSPGAHFRWYLVEPTEGSYVWLDSEVRRPASHGLRLLGNIGENAPSWAHRTYFTLSSVSGTFAAGETVTTPAGASGRIALVLDTTSATGWALQLTNVQGAFSQGALVTGQASRATGTISSGIHATSIALDKLETFVRNVVSHYKADVKWWEVWNEPHLDTTEIPSSTFYAEALKRAMRAIKTADATANIVAMAGIYRPEYGVEVISKLPSTWTNDIAAIAVHHYPGNGGLVSLFTQASQFAGKPIWNTETGTWDWGGFVGINANVLRAGIPLFAHRASERFYRSAVESPVLLAHNFLQHVGGGGRRYFYYDGRNSASNADFFDSHPSLIDYHEGLKPKGVAYAILGHLFGRSTGAGQVTTRDTNTEAYVFDRAGLGAAAIFSKNSRERELDLAGLLGGGSYQIIDFMGNSVTNTTTRVRYGRMPTYLVSSSASVSQLRQALQQGPVQLLADTSPPVISITLAPRGPIRLTDEVYLRWLAFDNVSFPDQVQPDALQYSWQLEGRDSNWSPWSAATSAAYVDVPPGRYRLLVRARDQAANQSEAAPREIVVLNADGSLPGGKPATPTNVRAINLGN